MWVVEREKKYLTHTIYTTCHTIKKKTNGVIIVNLSYNAKIYENNFHKHL